MAVYAFRPRTSAKISTAAVRAARPFGHRRARTVAADATTGVFYSTSTGKTADIAEVIKEKLGDSADGPFEVADNTEFGKYDNLLIGAPTWNTDAEEDRSGTAWDELAKDELGDLNGKNVAVFGLGDASGYGDYFCDAMGELHDKFEGAGATMMGYTPPDGYEFEASKSVRDGRFCGLPLDEDNQDDLSESRVESWIEQLKEEGMAL